MSKKNIAIITGGYSSERVISLASVDNFIHTVNLESYNYFVIDLSLKGWHVVKDMRHNNVHIDVDKNDFTTTVNDMKITFDLVIPILHGPPVENGEFLGYLEMLNIPYTGCKYFQSSLTFNKYYTNRVLSSYGINTSQSVVIHSHFSKKNNIDRIQKHIKAPFFIKPNNGGSSLGTFLIEHFDDFSKKIMRSFEHDHEVLCEEYVQGKEFSVGVYNYDNAIYVLPITEIVSNNTFFDFKAKYEGESEEITPARITDTLAIRITSEAKKIYQILSLNGIVRIDFILSNNDDKLYFLEVNTNPGLSSKSIITQQFSCNEKGLSILYEQYIHDLLTNQ